MKRSGFPTVSGQKVYEEINRLTVEIYYLDKDIETLEVERFPSEPHGNFNVGVSTLKNTRQEKKEKLDELKRTKYIPEQTYLQEKEDNDGT